MISTLTAVQNEIIERLASGQSVTRAAEACGIHRTTVHHWKRTNPEFANAYQDAKEDAADEHRAACHPHASLSLDTIVKLMEDPKTPASVRLKVALYILNGATSLPAYAKLRQTPAATAHSSLFNTSTPPVEKPQPTGRNEACPCGSNKKFKVCCLNKKPLVTAT